MDLIFDGGYIGICKVNYDGDFVTIETHSHFIGASDIMRIYDYINEHLTIYSKFDRIKFYGKQDFTFCSVGFDENGEQILTIRVFVDKN